MARYCRNGVLGTTDTSNVPCNNVANISYNRNECLMDNLCNYLGRNCICSFNTQSTRGLEEVSGILEDIGNNYITLRSTNSGRQTVCNTENLQFINVL